MPPSAAHGTTGCTVAVLGLGAMGLPMATRLAIGLTVRGFDIDDGRLRLAADTGVEPSGSAREAVTGADAVLVAVRSGAQLDDVLFGPDGVATALRPGAVVILTSTVGTEAIPATVAGLAAHGVSLVDAPLSGGPVRAAAGDLLCGVHIAAAAEALALAGALGLDPAATLEALEAGAAGSFILSNRGPRMLQAYGDDGAEVLSRLDIFVKDMGIVGKATRTAGLPTPLAAAAEQLFLLGQAHGLGAADDSAVIRVIAPGDGAHPARSPR